MCHEMRLPKHNTQLTCVLCCCSQGMSISKLVVNIQRAFAAGMVYVALSRCTSRDGLQVRLYWR